MPSHSHQANFVVNLYILYKSKRMRDAKSLQDYTQKYIPMGASHAKRRVKVHNLCLICCETVQNYVHIMDMYVIPSAPPLERHYLEMEDMRSSNIYIGLARFSYFQLLR